MDADITDTDRSPLEAFDEIVGRLESSEIATLQWLIDEIRGRFGASDRFDPSDPEFNQLVNQLAAKVI